MNKELPWWRKTALGWPIETYKGKPVKSFFRLIIQNIRKFVWGWHDKRESWGDVSLPLIKTISPTWSIKEFMSVQPMKSAAGLTFYMENMDANNPKVGQIFNLQPKIPHDHGGSPCCCCLRGEHWHKIYTPTGWVYEEGNEPYFQQMVTEYNIPYREEERRRHEEECKKYVAEHSGSCPYGISSGFHEPEPRTLHTPLRTRET